MGLVAIDLFGSWLLVDLNLVVSYPVVLGLTPSYFVGSGLFCICLVGLCLTMNDSYLVGSGLVGLYLVGMSLVLSHLVCLCLVGSCLAGS